MLPTLQYTDFHKFLVSVGGLSCGIGVAFPFVLLRNQSVFKITSRQLAELTPEGQKATRIQQQQIEFLLHAWPYISAFMLLLGLGLVVWGAARWKQQQSRADSREAAEVAKLEAEREKTYQETLVLLREHQAPADVADSIREEKASAVAINDGVVGNSQSQDSGGYPQAERELEPRNRAHSRITLNAAALDTRLAEEAILKNLKLAYGGRVDIVTDVRIGNAFADAAVTSPSNEIPNLLIDIRAVTSAALVRVRVDEAIAWSARVSRAAKRDLGKTFIPTVFLVTPRVFDKTPSVRGVEKRDKVTDRIERTAEDAFEDFQGLPLPLNLVVSSGGNLTPSRLSGIDWITDGPRVINLGKNDFESANRA